MEKGGSMYTLYQPSSTLKVLPKTFLTGYFKVIEFSIWTYKITFTILYILFVTTKCKHTIIFSKYIENNICKENIGTLGKYTVAYFKTLFN